MHRHAASRVDPILTRGACRTIRLVWTTRYAPVNPDFYKARLSIRSAYQTKMRFSPLDNPLFESLSHYISFSGKYLYGNHADIFHSSLLKMPCKAPNS